MEPHGKAIYLYFTMQKYYNSDPKRWKKYWEAFQRLARKHQDVWDSVLDSLQEIKKYQVFK